MLFKRHGKEKVSNEQLLTAETISTIYATMNYDAVAVGPLDLALGKDFLLNSSGPVPWLSANLYNDNNERLFQPSISVDRNGLRVGIIGITDKLPYKEPNLVVRNGEEELRDILPEISSTHDITILLTTVSYKTMRTIAERFPELDMIIGGDRRKGNIRGKLVNKTIITQTASQGKYLGMMSIVWRSKQWRTDHSIELTTLKQRLKAANRQLARLKRAKEEESNPSAQQAMEKLTTRITSLETDIRAVERKIEKETAGNVPGSTYTTLLMPLKPSIPEAPEIRSIIDAAERSGDSKQ